MITMKDIAAELNISPSTVSRTLSNSPEIGEETKQKVMALVNKYNYRPNRVARSLVKNNTFTIGYMIPDIADSFFSATANSIENVVRNSGHEIAYYSTQRKPEKVLEFLELAVDHRYSGMLITPDVWDSKLIDAIQTSEVPIICLRRKTPKGVNIPYVDSDHAGGVAKAVEHLIQHGHKHIAFIGFDGEVGGERKIGFIDAMTKHGLRPIVHIDPRAIITKKRVPVGLESMSYLLDTYPEVTAICAADDYLALGSIECLHKRNISIPQHFSVIGFDNKEIGRLFCTQISTVVQFQEEMGQQAANMLLSMIKNPSYIPDSHVFETELILRSSTGPCNR